LPSHQLVSHTTLLPLSAPIPKQYTPTFYVTPFRLLDPDDEGTMVL